MLLLQVYRLMTELERERRQHGTQTYVSIIVEVEFLWVLWVLPSAYTIFYFITHAAPCKSYFSPNQVTPPYFGVGESKHAGIFLFWQLFFLIFSCLWGLKKNLGDKRREWRKRFFWRKKPHVFLGTRPRKKGWEMHFWRNFSILTKKKDGNNGTREQLNKGITEWGEDTTSYLFRNLGKYLHRWSLMISRKCQRTVDAWSRLAVFLQIIFIILWRPKPTTFFRRS